MVDPYEQMAEDAEEYDTALEQWMEAGKRNALEKALIDQLADMLFTELRWREEMGCSYLHEAGNLKTYVNTARALRESSPTPGMSNAWERARRRYDRLKAGEMDTRSLTMQVTQSDKRTAEEEGSIQISTDDTDFELKRVQ